MTKWAKGFGCRLFFAAKVISFIPLLIVLFVLNPFWWIFTGDIVPLPKWMERMHD